MRSWSFRGLLLLLTVALVLATVAGALTKAVGHAWAQVCEYALTMDDASREQFLSSPQVTERFVGYLKDARRVGRQA